MRIDQHISELLYDHDCVIVPDFGGFVGNMRPARLDRVRNKFAPPHKEISFNRSLRNNDGLLANHISVQEAITYAEANQNLRAYVQDINQQLESGSRVEVQKVGTLYSDALRNIRFEPDTRVNYNRDAFGLGGFHAPVVKREVPKPVSAPEKVEPIVPVVPPVAKVEQPKPAVQEPVREEIPVVPIQPQEPEKKRRRIGYAAAAAILLFLMVGGYSFWAVQHSGAFGGSEIEFANLNPFRGPAPKYEERNGPMDYSMPDLKALPGADALPDSVVYVNVGLFDEGEMGFVAAETITARVRDAAPAVSTHVATTSPTMRSRFHVIGGCFRYLENAEKLVNQLRAKGYQAQIFDKRGGLYRVKFDSYPSRNDAVEALAKIKATENSGAWLLVK